MTDEDTKNPPSHLSEKVPRPLPRKNLCAQLFSNLHLYVLMPTSVPVMGAIV